MRSLSVAALALPFLIVSACATGSARSPVTFALPGTYVQVEPAPEQYTAVATTEDAYTIRTGTQVVEGEHWVDPQGAYHMVDTSGPCAGMESVWEPEVEGDRVMLTLISDECAARDFPQRLVFERMGG